MFNDSFSSNPISSNTNQRKNMTTTKKSNDSKNISKCELVINLTPDEEYSFTLILKKSELYSTNQVCFLESFNTSKSLLKKLKK